MWSGTQARGRDYPWDEAQYRDNPHKAQDTGTRSGTKLSRQGWAQEAGTRLRMEPGSLERA